MITFLDPRGEPSRPIESYAHRAELAPGETIGLFANGFPDSVAFLDHIEKALAALLPGVSFARYDKGDASALATEPMLDSIAETCSAIVGAYGH